MFFSAPDSHLPRSSWRVRPIVSLRDRTLIAANEQISSDTGAIIGSALHLQDS